MTVFLPPKQQLSEGAKRVLDEMIAGAKLGTPDLLSELGPHVLIKRNTPVMGVSREQVKELLAVGAIENTVPPGRYFGTTYVEFYVLTSEVIAAFHTPRSRWVDSRKPIRPDRHRA